MNLNNPVEVAKTVKEKTVKAEGSETLAVWTPGTGKRFVLRGFNLFSSVETLVTLEDGSTVIGIFAVPAKTNLNVNLPGNGYLSTVSENKLNLKTKVEGAVTATFYGNEEGY